MYQSVELMRRLDGREVLRDNDEGMWMSVGVGVVGGVVNESTSGECEDILYYCCCFAL